MKKKLIGLVVKKVAGFPEVIASFKLSATKTEHKLKGKIFKFDLDKPTYNDSKNLYYIIQDDNSLLNLEGYENSTFDPEFYNTIIGDEIIKQLIESQETKTNWMNMILPFIAGAGIFLFIGYLLPTF